MKNTLQAVFLLWLALFAPIGAFSAIGKSPTQIPKQEVKVIVTFDGEIDTQIVEKYGQVINTLKIINGVVAVIDRADIELLQKEEGIKDVALDSKISIIPEGRDPGDISMMAEAASDTNDIIVGWNLQEPGIAASDTPPPPNGVEVELLSST